MHYSAAAGKQTTPCICQKKNREVREGDGKYKKILILDYILVQTTEEKNIPFTSGFLFISTHRPS